MRIHLLSDLHLEHLDWTPPDVGADVVVLAGDIGAGTSGLRWARQHWPETPVIYVMGNHEFYGHHINGLMVEARAVARELGIHLLENDEVVLGGVRFLGATVWTDYSLYGEHNRRPAVELGSRSMADYGRIRTPTGWFTPAQSVNLHHTSIQWLGFKLRKETFVGKTVVVSHHLPHALSVAPQYEHNLLNCAFASNLEDLLGFSELWLHGHTHDSCDYVFEGTRVVCNPRGYPRGKYIGAPMENQVGFNPELVLEI
jgi:predicted phosphodiesterase